MRKWSVKGNVVLLREGCTPCEAYVMGGKVRINPHATIYQRALEYIVNAGTGATVEHFHEDHDPVGPKLLGELMAAGLVRIDDGVLHVNGDGFSTRPPGGESL